MLVDAPTGTLQRTFLLSERTTSMQELVTITFRPKAEYPFIVSNGKCDLHCISWNEASDKFDHFYAYVGEPNEMVN